MPDRGFVSVALWLPLLGSLVSGGDGRLVASIRAHTHTKIASSQVPAVSQNPESDTWQPTATSLTALNVANFGGLYRLKQASTGRYLDAYETVMFPNDRPGFEVVTRPLQTAPVKDGAHHSQFWVISKEQGDMYSIMQLSSGRFLMGTGQEDGTWQRSFVVCTRELNATERALEQRWYIKHVDHLSADVRISQALSQKYIDAFSTASRDYQVVLQAPQLGVTSQHWFLEKVQDNPSLDGLYTITQKSTDRQLDAYERGAADAYAFTAPAAFSTSQQFIVRRVLGQDYTITQSSTGRLLDCFPATTGLENFAAVLRDSQADSTQRWLFHTVGYNEFVLQHSMSGRLLEAYADNSSSHDYRVLTSSPTLFTIDGNSSAFVWEFKRVGLLPVLDGIYSIAESSSGRLLDLINPLAPGAYIGGPGAEVVTGLPRPGVDQHWIITPLEGDSYQISLNSTPAYLDALPASNPLWQWNYSATVKAQEPASSSQMWYASWVEGDKFRLRQQATGRWLSVGVGEAMGWQVNTRLWRDDPGQIWTLTKMGDRCLEKISVCPSLFECGSIDDGCGGVIVCGSKASCTQVNPVSHKPYVCTPDHACECIAKATCDAGPDSCGWESDGCGGSVLCGRNGACDAINSETGLAFKCSVERSAVLVPPAWNVGSCSCNRKTVCTLGAQCGNESDGCGGTISCGLCPLPSQICHMNNKTCSSVAGAPAPAPVAAPTLSPASTIAPETTTTRSVFSTTPPPSTTPPCAPKTQCDEGAECGMQDDGCGQFLVCGEEKGVCKESWDQCVQNKCVCEPKTCQGICGKLDTGCGKVEQCTCGMSNEICDEGQGICVNIPQPAIDPNLLGDPLPTTTEPPPPTSPEPPATTAKPALRGASTTFAADGTTVATGAHAATTTAKPALRGASTTFAADGTTVATGAHAATTPIGGGVASGQVGGFFGSAPAPAPFSAYPGAPGPAGVGPLQPPPPPGLLPGAPGPAGGGPPKPPLPPGAPLTEELYKHYVYYYYFYYYYHWSYLVTKKHVPPSEASVQAASLACAHAAQQLQMLLAPKSAPAAAARMANEALMKENADLRERLRALGHWQAGADPPSLNSSPGSQAAVQQQVLGKQLMDGLIGGDESSSANA